MTATKYTGVKYHDAKNGIRTYYIQYKLNGKVRREKIGTKSEGITPIYCKNLREKKLVQNRLGEDAPIRSTSKAKTLNELAEDYWKEKNEMKSLSKQQSLYKTHLAALGSEPITMIDKAMVKRFKEKKRNLISPKTKRPLSDKTINNVLALLIAILHYGEDKGDIKAVPKIEKYEIDNTRERFLSKEEISMLYEAIDNSAIRTKDRVKMFVKISLRTGARLGSVLSIQGKHINRTNNTVTLKNHKTGKTYTGFIPPELMDEIPTLEPQEYLIDVSDPKQIQRPLQSILNKLFNIGLNPEDRKERVVVHTLRHTFASHLAINGASIRKIMKLMDHSNVEMSMRYAKLGEDGGRSEVENLYG